MQYTDPSEPTYIDEAAVWPEEVEREFADAAVRAAEAEALEEAVDETFEIPRAARLPLPARSGPRCDGGRLRRSAGMKRGEARVDAVTEHDPNDERPKDEPRFRLREDIEGTGELRPGEYEAWIEAELAAGRWPCIIEQDDEGEPPC